MGKFAKAVLRLIEFILGLTLLFLTLIVFLNVVLRYGFNSGIDISDELSRLLFVWMIFVASALVCLERGHVAFTSLVEALPRKVMLAAKTIISVAVVVCCALLIQSSYGHAKLNLGNILPVSGISVAWFFFAGIAGGTGMLVATLINLAQMYFREFNRPEEDGQ